MEIEIRAAVDSINHLKEDLAKKASFLGSSSEDDLYFKHASDLERKLVLRIRRKQDGSALTFKSKSQGEDTAWHDVDLPLSNPDDLEAILRHNNYKEVVRIYKTRHTFSFQNYEINLDEIKDLGTFIEIEGRGSENERFVIEKNISKILLDLDIPSQNIIRKGYVALMIEKQNK